MKILSIESTCDETAAAIVEDGQRVHSNIIYSQIAEHNKTGGVVPEVAARRHVDAITTVIDKALKVAKITKNDIDAIAVAQGPGLVGCLMVGNNAASALSLIWGKTLIPVNHIEGHLYGNWLSSDLNKPIEKYNIERDLKEKFPIIILTVSGGHNQLVFMKNHGEYELLGETLDDAAGEAFDKISRMLGLGYPGGPEIQKIAQNGNEANGFVAGDPYKYKFPRALMLNKHAAQFNFSFSGLKTSVKQKIEELKKNDNFEALIPDLAASFEYTICDTLLIKVKKANDKFNPKEIHIAGGVSANIRLRSMLETTFPAQSTPSPNQNQSPKIRYPSLKFCTDNAAMIGSVAYYRYMANPQKYEKWRNSIPTINTSIFE